MPIPEPVAFTVFGLDIMWYAILVCSGMILATLLCCARAPKYGFTADQILNYVMICIPAGIIGARIYYILFNWNLYADDPIQMLNIRGGGLAIHGGLIAGLGTAVIICIIKHASILKMLDLIAPSIALGQSIGRWGNYFNSEAHGGPTDLPWAVIADGESVHPTFLYESIWCFLLFLFLLWFDHRRHAQNRHSGRTKKQAGHRGLTFDGQIILLYGILYSLERFFVEALRTDSLMIGPLKQAQVISIVAILVCATLYLLLRKRHREPSRDDVGIQHQRPL